MSSQNSNALAVIERNSLPSCYSTDASFEFAQRAAKALASSDLVPVQYKGNVANCMIALEMANRTGTSPMVVMQNLNVIHGRPAWSAQYVIGALNGCGRFAPLRFKYEGTGDKRSCRVITSDRVTSEIIEGPEVSMAMAKSENWTKNSKWQSMPDQMLAYRAGTFFGRLYAPDVLLGMQTDDELRDVTPESEQPTNEKNKALRKMNAKISADRKTKPAPVIDASAVEVMPDLEPAPEPEPVEQPEGGFY